MLRKLQSRCDLGIFWMWMSQRHANSPPHTFPFNQTRDHSTVTQPMHGGREGWRFANGLKNRGMDFLNLNSLVLTSTKKWGLKIAIFCDNVLFAWPLTRVCLLYCHPFCDVICNWKWMSFRLLCSVVRSLPGQSTILTSSFKTPLHWSNLKKHVLPYDPPSLVHTSWYGSSLQTHGQSGTNKAQ